jgi:hypothetical protein
VLEDAGLLLGEDDHLPGPFGEALKHLLLPICRVTTGLANPVPFLKIGIYADRMRGEKWVTGP